MRNPVRSNAEHVPFGALPQEGGSQMVESLIVRLGFTGKLLRMTHHLEGDDQASVGEQRKRVISRCVCIWRR